MDPPSTSGIWTRDTDGLTMSYRWIIYTKEWTLLTWSPARHKIVPRQLAYINLSNESELIIVRMGGVGPMIANSTASLTGVDMQACSTGQSKLGTPYLGR